MTSLPCPDQIGVRNYRFKLIWGQSSMLHRGYRTPQYSQGGVNTEFQTLQLYDLKLDPGEKRNIATRRKHILQKFQRLALEFYNDIVPPRFGISQSTIQVKGWNRTFRLGIVTKTEKIPTQFDSKSFLSMYIMNLSRSDLTYSPHDGNYF